MARFRLNYIFPEMSHIFRLLYIQINRLLGAYYTMIHSTLQWALLPHFCHCGQSNSASIHVNRPHYHCLVGRLCYCPINRMHILIKAHTIKLLIAFYFPRHIDPDNEINTLDQTEGHQPQNQYGVEITCYLKTITNHYDAINHKCKMHSIDYEIVQRYHASFLVIFFMILSEKCVAI